MKLLIAVAWYNFKLFNLELGGGGGLMMFLLLLSLLTSVHRINKLRRRDTQITKAASYQALDVELLFGVMPVNVYDAGPALMQQ